MNHSSITFEVWQEEFKKFFFSTEEYDKYPSDAIVKFILDMDKEDRINPLNAELKADLSVERHDSYGCEDSILKRVYYFPEYDLYVMFSGTRQSYSGEEWTEMKEVKPVIKHIETYE